MRALVVLAIAFLLLVALLPALRGGRRSPRGLGPRRDELVKDPVCQTYVVASRAIRRSVDGAPVYFCSAECAARHPSAERRA